MPETIPPFAVLMITLVFLTNALWYYVKVRLKREGKEISWFGDHFRDYRLLREVIAETDSAETRETFRRLLVALYCMPLVVLVCFAAMVVSVALRGAGHGGP